MRIKKEVMVFLSLLIILIGVLGFGSAATGITVTYPNGGEYLNDEIDITWGVTGNVGTDRFDVRYSNNGGINWVTIASRLYYTARSFRWNTFSVLDGSNYLIQVVESATSSADDVSNTVFTVDNTLPTSSVNSLSTYQNTLTFNVPFTITDANPDFVELYYRKDSSWTKYDGTFTSSPISFISTGEGLYEFYTIATDRAGNVESAPLIADASTTVDTTPPTVPSNTLTSPNGGEKIKGGSSYNILWNSASIIDVNLGTNNIKLEYTTDGTTWNLISSGEANDGSYSWNIPSIDSTTVKVKITATDLAGNSASDESNAVFTIDSIAPSIVSYTLQVTSNPETTENNVVFSPNGDGIEDNVDIDLAFSEHVNWEIEIWDEVSVVFFWTGTSTNPTTKTWNGIGNTGDKTYTIKVTATDDVGNSMTIDSSKSITLDTSVIYVGGGSLYTTIQSAIDAASPGDTIIVNAGTYIEDLWIQGKDNLELAGESGAIIKGASLVDDSLTYYAEEPNIMILSDGVKIHGFIIESKNSEVGKHPVGITIGASNVKIYDNNFNVAIGNPDYSVAIVTYCDASFCGAGPYNDNVDISGLNIHDNVFASLTGTGSYQPIYLNPDIGTGLVTIENNQLGGYIVRGIANERSNVLIQNNNIDTDLAIGDSWQGVSLVNWWGKDIDNVDILNNIINEFGKGIRLDHSSVAGLLSNIEVSGNTIQNSGTGIYVYKSASQININFNKIIGNTLGVQNDDTNLLNAENNWWGDLDPSNDVSVNVDYIPFAEDASLTRFYAPVLDAIGDKSINEGSPLIITLSATDADAGDTLTFSKDVTFGSLIGNVFTWTPTGADQGTHNVIFTVSDGDLNDFETITITVNNVAPVVDVGADKTANEGEVVSFSATATDAGGDSLTYLWDFGDTGISTDPSPTHTYLDDGIYIVTLSVNDGTDTVIDTLTVNVNNVNPVIDTINVDKTKVTIGEIIQFTASASDAGSNDILSYSWDFGDGGTSTNQNPTYAYSSRGTYTVSLIVTDGDGGSTTSTLSITVNDLIWILSDSDWNLVSVPKNLVDNSVLDNEMWYYDPTEPNPNDRWKNPTQINPGVGYWVNKSTNSELGLDYSGDCTGPFCLPSGAINIDALQNSWNLIGLTSTTPKNVSDAFKSMIYDDEHLPVYYVIRYNEVTNMFEFLTGSSPMNPGEGYWVYLVK